jgi:hypothetical protein
VCSIRRRRRRRRYVVNEEFPICCGIFIIDMERVDLAFRNEGVWERGSVGGTPTSGE